MTGGVFFGAAFVGAICRSLALVLIALAALGSLSAAAADRSPYIVVDARSGVVIAEREADQLWYPASLTKLMTAYVTFRALQAGRVALGSTVVQSANSASQEPVAMGFAAGTRTTLDDALKMMLVTSANDIAVAIAETVGGDTGAFVGAMNAEARRLGMAETRFETANGLPSRGEVSSARDLAILARAIWTDFPDRRPLFGIHAISWGSAVYQSPNLKLLERYRGAEGMKTGYTCSAGYNLVAVATRNSRTLLAVVLGRTSSNDRAELAARLLDDAFAGRAPSASATPVSLASARSDSAPVDMRLCSGGGPDRVAFGDTVLGSVVSVTQPVKVAADEPQGARPTAVARPATAKASPPPRADLPELGGRTAYRLFDD